MDVMTVFYLVLTAAMSAAATIGIFIYLQSKQDAKDLLEREQRAKGYLKESSKDFELVPVYTDSSKNKWYTFANPLKLPANRALAGEVSMRQAEMNLDRETLEDFITQIKTHANLGEITAVFYLIERIEERMTWACEENTLLSLANVYFLLEGENPMLMTEEFSKKKKELMTNDAEARSFFLTAAFKLTNTYSDISETDIPLYLMDKAQQSPNERLSRN